jgi:CubicO group peptidase (beta-lactamase class C family)
MPVKSIRRQRYAYVKKSLRFTSATAALAVVGALFVNAAFAAPAMPISPKAIDATVAASMKTFQVPGMAVGIIKDGKLVFAKGYGVRALGDPAPVDADTLFQIGSNTKSITAAALATLVDAGKIHWDDKVIQYLPQFQMFDPYVTHEFTIRDLMTHRSGLGKGAGDLMFYPTTDLSREEIIHGLRYLKPVSSFRSQYAYDNILYMVAGQIVPAVTGQSWEDYTETHMFAAMGMDGCAVNSSRVKDRSDVASPHAVVDGKLTRIPTENIDILAPGGGVYCNITGMAKYLETQLAHGKTPSGIQLFTPARSSDMWSMQTIRPIDPEMAALTRTNFSGYGLGWDLEDEYGYRRVSHTGGVPGTVTWMTMVPELNLGILVLTNQQDQYAMEAVGHQILDAYLSAPKRDWVATLNTRSQAKSANAEAIASEVNATITAASAPPYPLDAYVGRYNDPWRGDASVEHVDGKLILKISRTTRLEGALVPYNGNMFIVRWNDRSLNADAYVRFSQGFDNKIDGMTMRSVSPTTDFSFDFQDLDFKRIEPVTSR